MADNATSGLIANDARTCDCVHDSWFTPGYRKSSSAVSITYQARHIDEHSNTDRPGCLLSTKHINEGSDGSTGIQRRDNEGNIPPTRNSLVTAVRIHSQGAKIRVDARISSLDTRPCGTTETGTLLAACGTCRKLHYHMSFGTWSGIDRELEGLGPVTGLVDEISGRDRATHKLQSCFL